MRLHAAQVPGLPVHQGQLPHPQGGAPGFGERQSHSSPQEDGSGDRLTLLPHQTTLQVEPDYRLRWNQQREVRHARSGVDAPLTGQSRTAMVE